MGCGSCSSGGCGTGVPNGCQSNGNCGSGGCNKLAVFDWLTGFKLPSGVAPFDCVEVRFKNSRKEFFRPEPGLQVLTGEVVAVEATNGHDIGIVSLTGELVRIQMEKKKASVKEVKKIFRKAQEADLAKWQEVQALEKETMFKARVLAAKLNLQMKISDVEYQGDRSKATFYYTADDRVDFRELIKVMADEFKIRIEMRQIGARQEAGRLGGIGSCGRELCCSTWLTDFRSVSTSVARYQQLSLNPIKLAGQCGKLKCCLNFELDQYVEALKEFPDTSLRLQTKKGKCFHFKTDIFKRTMFYGYVEDPSVIVPLNVDDVKEIMEMNARGEKPENLKMFQEIVETVVEDDYENVVGQDSLTRFDHLKKRSKKKKKGKGKGPQNKQGGPSKGGNKGGQNSGNKPKGKGGNKPGNKKKGDGNKPKGGNQNPGNQNPGNQNPGNKSKSGNKPKGENKGGGPKAQGGENKGGQGQQKKRQAKPKSNKPDGAK